jgi:molybdopterin-biosynthesis enzyme MoeA-like protein
MQALLEAHYGSRITEAALSMADLPSGTSLCVDQGWPVLRLDLEAGEGRTPLPHAGRIYILPGVPPLLRAKVEALEALPGELPSFRPWALVSLMTTTDEAHLAAPLDRVVAEFEAVSIGSYPRFSPGPGNRLRQTVRITFESADAQAAAEARARLLSLLDPASIEPEA